MRDARDARKRAKRDVERYLQRVAIRAIVARLPVEAALEAALEAAHRANRECDPPLPDAAVAALVQVELAIESRRLECRCCNPARLIHE